MNQCAPVRRVASNPLACMFNIVISDTDTHLERCPQSERLTALVQQSSPIMHIPLRTCQQHPRCQCQVLQLPGAAALPPKQRCACSLPLRAMGSFCPGRKCSMALAECMIYKRSA